MCVKSGRRRPALRSRNCWETRLEILYFTVVAVGLYAISDAILDRIERTRGERFKHRELVFFAIILILALASFQMMGVLSRME